MSRYDSSMLMAREVSEQDRERVTVRLLPAGQLSADLVTLADLTPEPNPFHEPWYLVPALTHLSGDREIFIAEARNEKGVLIGMVPLTMGTRYGRMPVRHVTNWSHYQSFMGTPLIALGYSITFWEALLQALDESDWAGGFLTLTGLAEGCHAQLGLNVAARGMKRTASIVHRYERAMLQSDRSPEAYLEASLRSKKRKELRRLANRLKDLGTVTYRRLKQNDELLPWTDAFLALEAAGWKGARGAAMANTPDTTAFFHKVVNGAFAADRLDFQRLDLDGRAIAMLINFRTSPGSWSFKIAYDEALAHYSPGVLIELENLKRVLEDPELRWMDSCAVENHPMIDRLWMERRRIVQVSVPLSGFSRRATYFACRTAERTSEKVRKLLGKSAW